MMGNLDVQSRSSASSPNVDSPPVGAKAVDLGAPKQWGPLRRLALSGLPTELGSVHGLAYTYEIRSYAAERVMLSAQGTTLDRDAILALADDCLPAHREFASDLYLELQSLAAATGLTEAEALIVGGYTDFIDYVRAAAGNAPSEHNCTALVVPDERTTDGGFYAQTWDMHTTATERVVVLDLAPTGQPGATVFTTMGCLGQIGMNQHGICVGINNLTVTDGRPGVTWPFVVRQVLKQDNFDDALSVIVDAPVCGGHSYSLFTADGQGAVIEKLPTAHHVTPLADEVLAHTNHCLTPDALDRQSTQPGDIDPSTYDRLDDALAATATNGDADRRPIDVDRLAAVLADENSICRHPSPPNQIDTCGAVIMQPKTASMWASWGRPSENPFQTL